MPIAIHDGTFLSSLSLVSVYMIIPLIDPNKALGVVFASRNGAFVASCSMSEHVLFQGPVNSEALGVVFASRDWALVRSLGSVCGLVVSRLGEASDVTSAS
jgi:hypothetical protein